MAYYTYLIFLLGVFAARNDPANHLNVEWAGLEAVRYTYLDKTKLYNEILTARETVDTIK